MWSVGRSVGRTDGICIPAASSLTSGGSGRDVLENSAQRAAVFGRDGITHLCASNGRETLDLLDLQPVKSKAQSQRRPGGAKEQLVPPLLEKAAVQNVLLNSTFPIFLMVNSPGTTLPISLSQCSWENNPAPHLIQEASSWHHGC